MEEFYQEQEFYERHNMKTSQLQKTITLMTASLRSLVKKEDAHKHMPEKIGRYTFVKMMQVKKYPMFLVGLYKNRRGDFFVLKIWTGSQKNAGYYDLLHEILVTKTLRTIHRRVRKQLPVELRNFSVLRYTNHIQTKKQVIMITEYAKPRLDNPTLTYKQKFALLSQTREYLHILGKHATSEEKKQITSKSGATYIMQFLLIWLIAILKHPHYFSDLILGFFVFVNGIPALLKHPTATLTHGDLDHTNVFYGEKGVTITDLEQTIFSYECLEAITTMSSKKNSTKMIEEILNSHQWNSFNSRFLFTSLAVFTAIYSLTGTNSEEGDKRYISILKTANKIFMNYNNTSLRKRRAYGSN